MNLGQSMMVIAAMALLGFLALSANSSVMDSTEVSNNSEFGVTAVSLATSVIQEAMSKMFDQNVVTTGAITDSTALTPPALLGRDAGEHYRGGANDFNDFDDFNNLFIVYTSPLDPTPDASADTTVIVPGIRARFWVRCSVQYVNPNNLGQTMSTQTWHKQMVVSVTSPTSKDSIAMPSIMSYW